MNAGYRKSHYQHLPVDQVVAKGTRSMPTPCIIWIRTTSPRTGRPMFKQDGVTKNLYRAYWEYLNGPIPEGMTIDHTCYNKRCMNTEHFDVVTSEENTRRAAEMEEPLIKSNTQSIRDVFGIIISEGLLNQEQLDGVLVKYGEDATDPAGEHKTSQQASPEGGR